MAYVPLKPCPFCGSAPRMQSDTRYPRPSCEPKEAYEVVCSNYDCIVGGVDERYYPTARKAAEAWNRRINDG